MNQDEVYNMKAKPVFYSGIKFRSKTEARWAVIWDVLNMSWIYETERFIGNGGVCYEPDFYLPEFDVYGEVKGTTKQLFASQEKISAAIDWQATPVGKSNGLLLLGPPPYNSVQQTGYAVHGDYLFWQEGVQLGDFYIYSSPKYYQKPLLLERTYKDDQSGDFYLDEKIPPSASVECNLVWFSDSTTVQLYKALSYARSARFDCNDSYEKMLHEGRSVIGEISESKIEKPKYLNGFSGYYDDEVPW